MEEDPGWTEIFHGLNFTTVEATHSFDLGGGLRLTCLSIAESWFPSTYVAADPGNFHVVLGHCPNFALGKVPADLLVAGHTHGGQVRLPLVGALITLSKVPRRWAAGLTDLPGGGKPWCRVRRHGTRRRTAVAFSLSPRNRRHRLGARHENETNRKNGKSLTVVELGRRRIHCRLGSP